MVHIVDRCLVVKTNIQSFIVSYRLDDIINKTQFNWCYVNSAINFAYLKVGTDYATNQGTVNWIFTCIVELIVIIIIIIIIQLTFN